jgi:hypothetical protein
MRLLIILRRLLIRRRPTARVCPKVIEDGAGTSRQSQPKPAPANHLMYGEEAEAVDAGPFCSIGLRREMIRDMMVRCVEQRFDTITPGSARTRDAG